jgi:ketosteroid isomerase-like protein
MSRENVDVVRAIYSAGARGDAEAALSLYDPEVVFDVSRQPLTSLIGGQRVYHGHEGLRAFFRERSEQLQDVEDSYKELIDAGEHVVVVGTLRGRGRASGIPIERASPGAGVFTIRDGKVVRVIFFATREDALEAAGLQESGG